MSISDFKILDINESNIETYPPKCFLNPKNEGYLTKQSWLIERFKEGMKIKQIYSKDKEKLHGFIEYVPGEFAWRPVNANNYLFIHCVWITPNKFKNLGLASLLIEEVIKDAKSQNKSGVVVVTSEGAFMAGKDLFIKNGFECVETSKPSFGLYMKSLKKDFKPSFKNVDTSLKKTGNGLNLMYSNQCPWVARSIPGIKKIAKENGFDLKIRVIKTAEEAQNAPSVYGIFNLVYNGEILADHYISDRRFQNILNKIEKK